MDSPPWPEPPTEVLGAVVPIQQFVVRTANAVVALQHAVAFPSGCRLVIHVAVRRSGLDDAIWRRVADADPAAGSGGLRYGIREPGETVELVEIGAESSSDRQTCHRRQEIWLGPLPPPGPFAFVASWPDLGIAEATSTVDGAAIVDAAPRATPYWP